MPPLPDFARDRSRYRNTDWDCSEVSRLASENGPTDRCFPPELPDALQRNTSHRTRHADYAVPSLRIVCNARAEKFRTRLHRDCCEDSTPRRIADASYYLLHRYRLNGAVRFFPRRLPPRGAVSGAPSSGGEAR